MHFLRPDFTYITSVLQPIGGFSPGQAVMGNVDAFTMQGRGFQAGGTSMPLGRAMAPVRFLGLGRAAAPRLMGLGKSMAPVHLMGPKMAQKPVTFIKSSAGPFARLYTRLVAWGKGHRAVQLSGPAGGFFPSGPRPWAAQQVLPGPSQTMLQLVQMAQNYQPQSFAQNNTAAIMQRSGCNTRNG